ncbi:TetR family transcriptional regulator [Luteimicrobium album]|uniref:TetR family transcriptional regulator n=1 Tax=Luteimicrobium album TaxID=1054550 RepID=A0ABQ6HYS8_9MICO|nr:TetR/AcrR family transcriptional regulator [Luteimicrobium album]GMA23650.1 TetR family transcriptional regulator [Luteimicrobium album]
MPTGVRLHDPRQQLFDAAERVLLRDGPSALTSRAVTDEAGCAKGVLHRHFDDFDGFLVALVLDQEARLAHEAEVLRAAAGRGDVVDNLARALLVLFGPVPLAIIPLVTFRDELRARLRAAVPGGGVAVLAPVTTAVGAYLRAERDVGRISRDADVDSLTLTLVGGGHLLLAGAPSSDAHDRDDVRRLVTTALADVLPRTR